MKELSKTLKPYLESNINLYRLTSILKDEEYIDDKDIPIICQYCDSENLIKMYKVIFNSLENDIKNQIKELYPEIDDDSIITIWICDDCKSVVAIKVYEHKNVQEKRIYHHKFDSFSQIIKDLNNKGYLEPSKEPCKCWYCNSDNIQNVSDKQICICNNCNKILAYNYNNEWFLKVENDENE